MKLTKYPGGYYMLNHWKKFMFWAPLMTLFFFVLGKKHGQGNAEKGGLDLKIH